MRTLDVISTVVVVLMGVGNTIFTPVFAPGWTPGAAWFAGSGLALVFLGLLDTARVWGGGDVGRMRALCLPANLLTLLWGTFVIIVLPVPQAIVPGVAVLGCTVGSLSSTRRPARPA
jgi:hypothetical protein